LRLSNSCHTALGSRRSSTRVAPGFGVRPFLRSADAVRNIVRQRLRVEISDARTRRRHAETSGRSEAFRERGHMSRGGSIRALPSVDRPRGISHAAPRSSINAQEKPPTADHGKLEAPRRAIKTADGRPWHVGGALALPLVRPASADERQHAEAYTKHTNATRSRYSAAASACATCHMRALGESEQRAAHGGMSKFLTASASARGAPPPPI
jgi:hypothetical protein